MKLEMLHTVMERHLELLNAVCENGFAVFSRNGMWKCH